MVSFFIQFREPISLLKPITTVDSVKDDDLFVSAYENFFAGMLQRLSLTNDQQKFVFLWGKIEQDKKTVKGVCMANSASERGVFIMKRGTTETEVILKILFYDGWMAKYVYSDINYVIFGKLIPNS